MHRAYKYRIYPDKGQSLLIDKTFGCVRFLYNKMLEDMLRQGKEGKKKLPLPASYKEAYPWLKEVDSLALANAQMHLSAAWGNFYRESGFGFPRFKSKKGERLSYTTNNQKGSVRLEAGGRELRLPKLKGVRIKLHRPLPEGAALKAATVSKSATGKYHVSLLLDLPGEDAGKSGAASCGGIEYPAACRKTGERLLAARERVKRCRGGSKRREKARRKAAALSEKLSNQRKDYLHKLSRRIANAGESVGGGQPGDAVGKGQQGYGLLREFLAYKLAG
jgi:putative transposase